MYLLFTAILIKKIRNHKYNIKLQIFVIQLLEISDVSKKYKNIRNLEPNTYIKKNLNFTAAVI